MGTRKALVLDPDATARKVAAMAVGRAQEREARLEAKRILSELTSLDLDGAYQRRSSRAQA